MTVQIHPGCRFFRPICCAHPARLRSWRNPLSWVGLRRPACVRLIDDPCPLREPVNLKRPAPAPFRPGRSLSCNIAE